MTAIFANIDDYITSPELESEGVDYNLGKGRFITIRRAGGANEAFKLYSATKLKEFSDVDLEEDVDEDFASEVMYDIYAKKVVMDWRGFVDAEGKEIPYSVDNCVALFNASKEIYQKVFNASNDLDNFRVKEIKKPVKG